MFKISEVRSVIKNECEPFLKDKAQFQCLSDGIMEYELIDDYCKHTFSIIADDNFVNQMEVEWLLDLKRVKYFSHEVYLKQYKSVENTEEEWVFEVRQTFNINECSTQN